MWFISADTAGRLARRESFWGRAELLLYACQARNRNRHMGFFKFRRPKEVKGARVCFPPPIPFLFPRDRNE